MVSSLPSNLDEVIDQQSSSISLRHALHVATATRTLDGNTMDPPRPASDDSFSSSGSRGQPKRPIDPITRTALRYTISPREYELLHQYLISRAPERVQKRTPNPPRYEKITKSTSETSDYNVASFRAALRVFVAAYTGLKGWELVAHQLASRRGGAQYVI